METTNMILFITISAIALSYGWGMRGTTIGGEKGAMLPGAIMGLLIAFFSGSPILRENFFMLSAVGSMGMYFGGSMTYGETLGISMNTKPPENLKKGLIALFIKGWLWLGLFGAFMGIYLTASTGKVYSSTDFLILLCLLPPCALAGYFLLNKPLNAKEGIFPKIYFSKTRQESWGGLLGIFVLLVIMMSVRRDFFALKLTLGSAVSGAVAWVIGQSLQIFAKYPMKNGKYFFKRLQKNHMLDAWKIMECTLGLIIGIGISLTICLLKYDMGTILMLLQNRGGLWNPLEKLTMPLTIVWVVLILLDMLQYFIKEPLRKTELDKLLSKTLISRKKYDREIKRTEKSKHGKCFKVYRLLAEAFEFPIYSVLPLTFVLLGNREIAKLASFFVVYLVIVQKVGFERINYFKSRNIVRFLTLSAGAAIIIAHLFFDWSASALLTMLMYGIFYEVITMAYTFFERDRIKTAKKDGLAAVYGSTIPTHSYFCLCVLIMSVFAVVVLK